MTANTTTNNSYDGIDLSIVEPYGLSLDPGADYLDNIKILQDFIANRNRNLEFRRTLTRRTLLGSVADSYNKALEESRHVNNDRVDVTALTIEARPEFERLHVIRRKINDLRAPSAAAALLCSQIRNKMEQENGTFIEYTDNTIGNLVALCEYEIGSQEWHDQRKAGIGGSDVGKILKAGDPTYAGDEYLKCLRTKTGVLVEVDSPDRDDFATAIGRGCTWEEHIRHIFADRHPKMKVAFCKTSWGGSGLDSYRHANFDGLILADDGTPEGILEIKTGTHSAMWGPSDRIEDAPTTYVMQAVWYAMNANLDYGYIAAVLDDYDYREFRFSMDDPYIQDMVEEIETETEKFWLKVEQYRRVFENEGIDLSSGIRKGFGKKVDYSRASAKWFGPYADLDDSEAKIRVAETFGFCYKHNAPQTKEFEPKYDGHEESKSERAAREARNIEILKGYNYEVMSSLFSKIDPKMMERPFVGIDIETSHLAPKHGRIIETGVVTLDSEGRVKTVIDQLHGIPQIALDGIGTGMVNVHKITPEMIEDKPFFEDKDFQAELLDLLKSGVMVAHNAGFEKQWLDAYLEGFLEARMAGEIRVLDTRMLAEKFILQADDNTLSSFAEYNGVKYVNAHRAAQDTEMMMKALWQFMNSMHDNGEFVPTFC